MPEITANRKIIKLSKKSLGNIRKIFQHIQEDYGLPAKDLESKYTESETPRSPGPRCKYISTRNGKGCENTAKHSGFCGTHKKQTQKHELLESMFRQRFEQENDNYCDDIEGLDGLLLNSQSQVV
jgi:hypothetical protein